MVPPAKRETSSKSVDGRLLLALLAGGGWGWAFALLAVREHEVMLYYVIAPAPPTWGFLALDTERLLLALALAGIAVWLCVSSELRFARVVGWLLAALAIPAVDLLRLAGVSAPHTFLEPLWLVLVTTAAVRSWADGRSLSPRVGPRASVAAVWALTIAFGFWCYLQGGWAYDDYLLGYHDFGHFAYRVANTWEGRGFLLETPSLPAFWDHFNPGLALLAPLWGVWPDARLFLMIQAVCLAAPAPLIYGAARRWGAEPLTAALWALAYLAFPVTSQMNLSYSYGWHPVSMALPLIFAAVYCLLARRYAAAVAATVLACSFQETVPVILACLALVMAAQAFVARRGIGNQTASVLAERMPWQAWLAAWGALSLGFVLIYHFSAFSQYQIGRFSNLGGSTGEVILSPVLRPGEFWGRVLRPESAYFLLALLLPLGWRTLLRGWPTLLALAPPVGVLLAWKHEAAVSLAFQYLTELMPILWLAALHGSARQSMQPSATAAPVAVAGCLVASAFFGAMPWSSPTMTVMRAETYQAPGLPITTNPREAGSPGHGVLEEAVRMAGRPDAAVLASGRVASHLLHVRRLEPVDQAVEWRWQALAKEAGPGKSAIELFDWVILDTWERFQQSPEAMDFVLREARQAGYRVVRDELGVVVLARP